MTESEAIELLKYHACSHEDINSPKWEKGFLGMLRPFTGELYESNYDEAMEIIKTLKPVLQAGTINRDIVADLWNICFFSRAWGIDTDGMLQRNKLITEEQLTKFTSWVDDLSLEIAITLNRVD